jgi:transcriptional regulator with XRE-family HTH domain
MLNHRRLRELRELARVTIQDAAALVGISYTSLCNYELGHGKLSDRQIEGLEAFCVPKVAERLASILKSL